MKSIDFIKKIWPLLIVLAVGVVICLFIYRNAINKSQEEAEKSFMSNKQETAEQVKDYIEDTVWKKTYESNKVENKVTISLESLKMENALEVLRVQDVQFIIEDKEDNDENITSWLKVPGSGVYTVDLTAAEFIIDNERKFVLVRIPKPELNYCEIDDNSVKPLFFKNDIMDDSYSEGEQLANKQLQEGSDQIKKSIGSNATYYQMAKKLAKQMITSLVKGLNGNIEGLTVEVEFID